MKNEFDVMVFLPNSKVIGTIVQANTEKEALQFFIDNMVVLLRYKIGKMITSSGQAECYARVRKLYKDYSLRKYKIISEVRFSLIDKYKY